MSLKRQRGDDPSLDPSHLSCVDQAQSTTSGETDSTTKRRRVSDGKWFEIECHNRCKIGEYVEDMPQFNDLANAIKFPRSILTEQFIQWVSHLDTPMHDRIGMSEASRYTFDYRVWVQSLPDDKIETDDPYGLERWSYALYPCWAFHYIGLSEFASDMEMQNATELLFKLAFRLRSSWRCLFNTDRELFLPAFPHLVTAGVLLSVYLPHDWVRYVSSLPNSQIFSTELDLDRLVIFISEATLGDPVAAKRKLTLGLTAAQHQRRALGIDGPVFGSTISGNVLRLYCSEWKFGRVVVWPILPIFRLDGFPAFIRCYVFLCKVADYVRDSVDKVFKEWETEDGRTKYQERSRNASGSRPWRSKYQPRRGHNQLHRENLRLFDAQQGVDLEGTPTGTTEDIIKWVHTAESEE